ncbi:Lrp/AsnC family transcriptional regulator [Actinacidiphila glaucinigra]|uniref:Lrp/AsnC family transcriptional regulator n=1 Tax=Actinacidiphila glaucinigra TaxID=235986 RepID=UPI0033C8CDEA
MAEYPDATVRAIRHELQRGRIPLTELARRVGLGASATTERVRRLETLGVITGCRAEAGLGKAGCPVPAVVRLYPGSRHEPLHRLLGERPEILECLGATGEECHVLKVAAASMVHLEEVMDESARFGSVTTSVVCRQTLPYRGPGGAPSGML